MLPKRAWICFHLQEKRGGERFPRDSKRDFVDSAELAVPVSKCPLPSYATLASSVGSTTVDVIDPDEKGAI